MGTGINYVTFLFVFVGLLPLFLGLTKGIKTESVIAAMVSVVETLGVFFGLLVSIALIDEFFVNPKALGVNLLKWIMPQTLRENFMNNPLLAYAIFAPILLLIFFLFSHTFLKPIYTSYFKSMHASIDPFILKMPSVTQHWLGFFSGFPKSILYSVLLAFFLNFSIYFSPSGHLSNTASHSKIYAGFFVKTVKPILGNRLSKNIRLIANQDFVKKQDSYLYREHNDSEHESKRSKVISYFNGVSLEEAVESTQSMDEFSVRLTKDAITTRDKARVIYDWITQNIKYDDPKAANIARHTSRYSSGATEAFYKKKGICFDYASLFISMCIANDIKVSLVTGLGYNGSFWGDHAWNQFYFEEEMRWVNIDTTFGTVGEHFDNRDFHMDHKFANIREVWE
jgi:AraC-like DNA-binding protein